MPGVTIICPHCKVNLQGPKAPPAGAAIRCPTCRQVFKMPSAPLQPLPVATRIAPTPTAPVRAAAPSRPQLVEAEEDEHRPRRKKRAKQKSNMPVVIIGALVGGLIIILGIVVVVMAIGMGKKDASESAGAAAAPRPGAGGPRGAGPGGPGRDGAAGMDDNAMQQSISRLPAWNPDPAQEDKLGEDTSLGDQYAFRLPKGYTVGSAAGGDGANFVWQKEPKAGSSAASITATIRNAPSGVPFQSLGQTINAAWSSFSHGSTFTSAQETERPSGRVNDWLTMRISFTATRAADQKRVKGAMFGCYDKDKILLFLVITPEENSDDFAAAEAAVLTIHRK